MRNSISSDGAMVTRRAGFLGESIVRGIRPGGVDAIIGPAHPRLRPADERDRPASDQMWTIAVDRAPLGGVEMRRSRSRVREGLLGAGTTGPSRPL